MGVCMFSEATRNSIIVLACADTKVTESEKNALQRVLCGDSRVISRVVKYKDAAKILGVSYPTIKNLVARNVLKGVAGGSGRMIGVTEESLIGYCS